MKRFEPIVNCKFGELASKVDLSPDFFTGFQPENRRSILDQEEAFYHNLTAPYSVDDRIEKKWISVQGEESIPVKVYAPKGCDSKLPAVVFMHGGGFITCSAETHDYVPSYLAANARVKVFNVEYRLAPEHKYPAGLEDCYTVLRYLTANADALGIDAERISVCGDSSGGNYSAVMCLMARDRGDVKIRSQVLIYPCTEMTGTIPRRSAQVYAPVGGTPEGETFLQRYLNDENAEAGLPYVSPMLVSDLSNLPPALLITAECDPLADEGLIYAKLLQDAGVPVEYSVYEGMPHAFILRVYSETFDALDRICEYLKRI